jgi:succinate-acetate transporter protein
MNGTLVEVHGGIMKYVLGYTLGLTFAALGIFWGSTLRGKVSLPNLTVELSWASSGVTQAAFWVVLAPS